MEACIRLRESTNIFIRRCQDDREHKQICSGHAGSLDIVFGGKHSIQNIFAGFDCRNESSRRLAHRIEYGSGHFQRVIRWLPRSISKYAWLEQNQQGRELLLFSRHAVGDICIF